MPAAITVDTRDVLPLLRGLQGVQADLRRNANAELRAAAATTAAGLVTRLRLAGDASSTPQAALVASTVRVKSDRVPAVSIGGPRRVGHRRTAAGVLLWGSERGGRNFPGGGHWIAPTVEEFKAGPAADAYYVAVAAILRKYGVL